MEQVNHHILYDEVEAVGNFKKQKEYKHPYEWGKEEEDVCRDKRAV